jgi:hypothetical protein
MGFLVRLEGGDATERMLGRLRSSSTNIFLSRFPGICFSCSPAEKKIWSRNFKK